MSEDSPKLPIVLTPNLEDHQLVESLLRIYRLSGLEVPSNLPTACALKAGARVEFADVRRLAGTRELFIYWDDGSKLRHSRLEEVAAFLDSREPWEEYDFCMFPKSLVWCAGFTHNNDWFLSHLQQCAPKIA
jgi:hypothetical protein